METKLIATYINSKFSLYSGLDADGFAKTYMSRLVDEEGTLFTIKDDIISAEKWHFTDTITTDDKQVIYTGDFDNGICFHSILFSDDKDKNISIINVLKCFDYAISNLNDVKTVGAGGIFYSQQKESVKILFLPAQLYEQSAMNSSQYNYSQIQGKYIRKGLENSNALKFTRSAIAYIALTGIFPYNEDDTFKRQADIIDGNFTPISLMINGIDEQLAVSIDASLVTEPDFSPLPGEKRFQSNRAIKRKNKIFTLSALYETKKVENELNLSAKNERTALLEPMEFTTYKAKYLKNQKRKIAVTRFFKRNWNIIKFATIAFLVLFYAGYSYYSGQQKHVTTIGLTSTQTCQLLYSAIHNESPTVLSDISKGKTMDEMDQKLSAFYVMNREREVASQDAGTLTPAQWLFFTEGTTFWQYGLTNLKVDGVNFRTDLTYPTRKEHGEPLVYEDGQFLSKGKTKDHKVSFNFIYYSGPTINIVTETDTVTTTYDGKKWVVTNVKVDSVNHKMISLEDFKNDYNSAIKTSGKNIRTASSILRSKYNWIPTNLELEVAAQEMINRFNNSAAKKFLGLKETN